MVSTVIHLALAGILAVALLRDAFDVKSLLVVLSVVVLIDFDTFLGWWMTGAHRAAFHTLLLPIVAAGVLWYDTRYRERSWLRERYADRGVRVAWVSVAVVVFAGIGPDFFSNGVNLLYPVHDQFYQLNGHIQYSNQKGLIQTFVDFSVSESSGGDAGKVAVGSTNDVQNRYRTGFDPQPAKKGVDSTAVERIFPIVDNGQQLLLVVTSAFLVVSRLVEERRD